MRIAIALTIAIGVAMFFAAWWISRPARAQSIDNGLGRLSDTDDPHLSRIAASGTDRLGIFAAGKVTGHPQRNSYD